MRRHSESCSCTNCVHKIRSKRSPVQQFVTDGTRIDKLFYGKYLPLRERKLLEKLVRTRVVYDNVKNRLLSSSGSSDQARSEYTGKSKGYYSNMKKQRRDVTNGGEIRSTNTSKRSSCCNCCSCSSMKEIKDSMAKYSPIHKHYIPYENIAKYKMNDEVRAKARRRRLGSNISGKIRDSHLKSKNIRSDPCFCTLSLTQFSSKTSIKKFGSKENAMRNVGHALSFAELEERNKPGPKLRSIKESIAKSIGTRFKIKKDSLSLFREKLRKRARRRGIYDSESYLSDFRPRHRKSKKKGHQKHSIQYMKSVSSSSTSKPKSKSSAINNISKTKTRKKHKTKQRNILNQGSQVSLFDKTASKLAQYQQKKSHTSSTTPTSLKTSSKSPGMNKLNLTCDCPPMQTQVKLNSTPNYTKRNSVQTNSSLSLKNPKAKYSLRRCFCTLKLQKNKRKLKMSTSIKRMSPFSMQRFSKGASAWNGETKSFNRKLDNVPMESLVSVLPAEYDYPKINKHNRKEVKRNIKLTNTKEILKKSVSSYIFEGKTPTHQEKTQTLKRKKRHTHAKGVAIHKPRINDMKSQVAKNNKRQPSNAAAFWHKCMCSLNVFNKHDKKKVSAFMRPENKNDMTYDSEDVKYLYEPSKLLPFECESGICVPNQCNPHKCEKFIKARHETSKNKYSDTSTKNIPVIYESPEFMPYDYGKKIKQRNLQHKNEYQDTNISRRSTYGEIPKQIISSQTQKSKSQDRNTTNRYQKYEGNNLSPVQSKRETVRIGSNFSFNIEFYKERSQADSSKANYVLKSNKKDIREKLLTKNEYMKRRPHTVNTSTKGSQPITNSKHIALSPEPKFKKRNVYIGSPKKTCLCTLKFQKKGKNENNREKIFLSNKSTKTAPILFESRLNTSVIKSTNTSKIPRHDHKNFECTPGLCVPDKCDPFKCYDVKKRDLKRRRGRHVATGREKRSVVSMTSSELSSSIKSRSTQSNIVEQPLEKRRGNKIHDNLENYYPSSRHAIRIGSNFSFNVDFYKDHFNPNINHKTVPIMYNTVGNLSYITNIKHKRMKQRQYISKHQLLHASDIVKSIDKMSNSSNMLKRSLCSLTHQSKEDYNKDDNYIFCTFSPDIPQSAKDTLRQKCKKSVCKLKSLNILYSDNGKCTDNNKLNQNEPIANIKSQNRLQVNYFNQSSRSSDDGFGKYYENNKNFIPKSRQYNQHKVSNVFNNPVEKNKNPFYKSYYALNVKVSYTGKVPNVLEDDECEPGFCVPYQCDTAKCLKRIKSRFKSWKQTETDTPYTRTTSSMTDQKQSSHSYAQADKHSVLKVFHPTKRKKRYGSSVKVNMSLYTHSDDTSKETSERIPIPSVYNMYRNKDKDQNIRDYDWPIRTRPQRSYIYGGRKSYREHNRRNDQPIPNYYPLREDKVTFKQKPSKMSSLKKYASLKFRSQDKHRENMIEAAGGETAMLKYQDKKIKRTESALLPKSSRKHHKTSNIQTETAIAKSTFVDKEHRSIFTTTQPAILTKLAPTGKYRKSVHIVTDPEMKSIYSPKSRELKNIVFQPDIIAKSTRSVKSQNSKNVLMEPKVIAKSIHSGKSRKSKNIEMEPKIKVQEIQFGKTRKSVQITEPEVLPKVFYTGKYRRTMNVPTDSNKLSKTIFRRKYREKMYDPIESEVFPHSTHGANYRENIYTQLDPESLSKSSRSSKYRKLMKFRTDRASRLSRSRRTKMPGELEKFLMKPPRRRVYTIGSSINFSMQFYKEDDSVAVDEKKKREQLDARSGIIEKIRCFCTSKKRDVKISNQDNKSMKDKDADLAAETITKTEIAKSKVSSKVTKSKIASAGAAEKVSEKPGETESEVLSDEEKSEYEGSTKTGKNAISQPSEKAEYKSSRKSRKSEESKVESLDKTEKTKLEPLKNSEESKFEPSQISEESKLEFPQKSELDKLEPLQKSEQGKLAILQKSIKSHRKRSQKSEKSKNVKKQLKDLDKNNKLEDLIGTHKGHKEILSKIIKSREKILTDDNDWKKQDISSKIKESEQEMPKEITKNKEEPISKKVKKKYICQCNMPLSKYKKLPCQCKNSVRENKKLVCECKGKRKTKYEELCDCTPRLNDQRSKTPKGSKNSSVLSVKSDVLSYDKSTSTRGKGFSKNLYECEPHVCIPGVCDPNVCFKIFKSKRRVKNISISAIKDVKSKSIGTLPLSYLPFTSSLVGSSAIKRCFCILKLKNREAKRMIGHSLSKEIEEKKAVQGPESQNLLHKSFFKASSFLKKETKPKTTAPVEIDYRLEHDTGMKANISHSLKYNKQGYPENMIEGPKLQEAVSKKKKRGYVCKCHQNIEAQNQRKKQVCECVGQYLDNLKYTHHIGRNQQEIIETITPISPESKKVALSLQDIQQLKKNGQKLAVKSKHLQRRGLHLGISKKNKQEPLLKKEPTSFKQESSLLKKEHEVKTKPYLPIEFEPTKLESLNIQRQRNFKRNKPYAICKCKKQSRDTFFPKYQLPDMHNFTAIELETPVTDIETDDKKKGLFPRIKAIPPRISQSLKSKFGISIEKKPKPGKIKQIMPETQTPAYDKINPQKQKLRAFESAKSREIKQPLSSDFRSDVTDLTISTKKKRRTEKDKKHNICECLTCQCLNPDYESFLTEAESSKTDINKKKEMYAFKRISARISKHLKSKSLILNIKKKKNKPVKIKKAMPREPKLKKAKSRIRKESHNADNYTPESSNSSTYMEKKNNSKCKQVCECQPLASDFSEVKHIKEKKKKVLPQSLKSKSLSVVGHKPDRLKQKTPKRPKTKLPDSRKPKAKTLKQDFENFEDQEKKTPKSKKSKQVPSSKSLTPESSSLSTREQERINKKKNLVCKCKKHLKGKSISICTCQPPAGDLNETDILKKRIYGKVKQIRSRVSQSLKSKSLSIVAHKPKSTDSKKSKPKKTKRDLEELEFESVEIPKAKKKRTKPKKNILEESDFDEPVIDKPIKTKASLGKKEFLSSEQTEYSQLKQSMKAKHLVCKCRKTQKPKFKGLCKCQLKDLADFEEETDTDAHSKKKIIVEAAKKLSRSLKLESFSDKRKKKIIKKPKKKKYETESILQETRVSHLKKKKGKSEPTKPINEKASQSDESEIMKTNRPKKKKRKITKVKLGIDTASQSKELVTPKSEEKGQKPSNKKEPLGLEMNEQSKPKPEKDQSQYSKGLPICKCQPNCKCQQTSKGLPVCKCQQTSKGLPVCKCLQTSKGVPVCKCKPICKCIPESKPAKSKLKGICICPISPPSSSPPPTPPTYPLEDGLCECLTHETPGSDVNSQLKRLSLKVKSLSLAVGDRIRRISGVNIESPELALYDHKPLNLAAGDQTKGKLLNIKPDLPKETKSKSMKLANGEEIQTKVRKMQQGVHGVAKLKTIKLAAGDQKPKEDVIVTKKPLGPMLVPMSLPFGGKNIHRSQKIEHGLPTETNKFLKPTPEQKPYTQQYSIRDQERLACECHKSDTNFFKCLFKKRIPPTTTPPQTMIPGLEKVCPVCLRRSLTDTCTCDQPFSSMKRKSAPYPALVPGVCPECSKHLSEARPTHSSRHPAASYPPGPDLSTHIKTGKSKGKTTEAALPKPVFSMVVDATSMKVKNKEEIYRTLKIGCKDKLHGRYMPPAKKGEEYPPSIDLVIDRDNACILRPDDMMQPFRKGDRRKYSMNKQGTIAGTSYSVACPFCNPLPGKGPTSIRPQHDKHCTCCICTDKDGKRKKGHPKNCTCCICRYGCRFGSMRRRTDTTASLNIPNKGELVRYENPEIDKSKKEAKEKEKEKEKEKGNEKGIEKQTKKRPESMPIALQANNAIRNMRNLAKTMRIRRACFCGLKICDSEIKKLETRATSGLRGDIPPPCVCGSRVCKKKYTGKTSYYREREAKKLKDWKRRRDTCKRWKAEALSRIKAQDAEDNAMRKRTKRQDKKAIKELDKYIDDISSWALIAENASDIGRFGINTMRRMMTTTMRCVRHPFDICYRASRARAQPRNAAAKALEEFQASGYGGAAARVKKRCAAMQTSRYVMAAMDKHPVTKFLYHLRDKDPKNRLLKKKSIVVKDTTCNPFLTSLRKTPCLWLYQLCPWFYPHCLGLLTFWRQFTDVILFLLAVAVWSPCILFMELCRTVMCCFMCAGGG